jgi:peptidoglycan/LPS O-acetylase OafA/YrhL
MAMDPDVSTPDRAVAEPDRDGAAKPPEPLRPLDVIKTYRYLRMGMIGAVILLAASIALERSKVDCWQTSISAYYYTPVRAIFVGSMMAVGLSLIVYKGRSLWEDACLNVAGMLAPVVAIAPTTDVGTCWSVAPIPRPVDEDGSLADWVVTNIDNNFDTLLIAGGVGLILTAIITVVNNRNVLAPVKELERGTHLALGCTAVGLLFAWWLSRNWSDFNTRAHGLAAVFMFIFLIGAIIATAAEHWQERDQAWFRAYTAVVALMVLGGTLIPTTRIFAEHTVFALEAYEITLFAVYWGIQTAEKWDEKVKPVESGTTG